MEISSYIHPATMNNYLILVLFLLTIGCQSKPEHSLTQNPTPREMTAGKAPSPRQNAPEQDEDTFDEPQARPVQQPNAGNRGIIRNAQLRIRVNDFKMSGQTIERTVQQAGGQITNANETKSYNTIENALTIRVPAARFDVVLASLLNESIFTDTKTISADDVTRRYVDTEARIRSKKVVEETFLKLLKQARNVEEVLKVEEQLAAIREEREVQEAVLRQLKDEVAMSTINLTYYQQTEVALQPEEPFYSQIWHNLTDGFRLIGNVFVGLFYFLPLALVGGGATWLFQRWRQQRRNKPM